MWRVLADAFRNLWLQLVKRYHPDLALSQQDKERRHEMMIAINRAYEDTDAGTLQEIAETGKLPPPKRVQMPGGSPGRAYPGTGPRPRYREQGSSGIKESELREWKRYLRVVAEAMEPYGYAGTIYTTAGGPAVAGEVSANFFAPGKEFGVYVQCSSEQGRPAPILFRWTGQNERGKHTQTGPNQWTKKTDAASLASLLFRVAEKQNKDRAPEF